MTRAIVLGGSRGIGKAISDSLRTMQMDVFAASKEDIDTSDLNSVKKFLEEHDETDILVLNTGGPDPKPFLDITENDWNT
jgi:3-oxoacyl-[acyl-carrier protein] reductase